MSLRLLSFLPFPAIVVAFLYLHTRIYFNSDVAYLLIVAQRMLEGGQYVRDFFESNPPMIIYLSMPAVWLTKWFPGQLFFIFDSYVFGLIILSVCSSSGLLKRIIQNKFIYFGILYTLLIVLLLLCYQDYGQREHLFLILTLPYFFAAALRYQRQDIALPFAFYIGVLAGLGFAIKPTFLVPLCLVELAFIIQQRHLLAWVRTESIVVLMILCLYLASVFIFTNSYIHTVLPYVSKYYFKGMAKPWSLVLLNPLLIYSLSCTITYFLFSKYDRYPALGKILLLAQMGMITSCLATKTIWFYHILPAFSLSFLLMTFCVLQLIVIGEPQLWRSRLGCLSVLIFDAIYTLAYAYYVKPDYAYFIKPDSETIIFFFKFFTVLQIFCMLMLTIYFYWFLLQKKRVSILIGVSLVILLVFAMLQLHNDIELFFSHKHFVFDLMLFMDSWIVLNIIACLWMCVSRFSINSVKNTLTVQRIVVWSAVISFIYFSPLNILYEKSLSQLELQRTGDQLVHYLKTPGATKVDCFSSAANMCFPMINYSGQQFSGRESNFWWFSGLVFAKESSQTSQDADYLINLITTDLNKHKPQLIVMDTNMFYGQHHTVFVKNKSFQQAWRHYRLKVGIPDNSLTSQFYVYSRID